MKSDIQKYKSANYVVYGHYYGTRKKLYRKVLEIKHKKSIQNIPDLMVIMMNPGGSQPLKWKGTFGSLTEAKPYRTQNRIMRLMHELCFYYARILNLSDICEIDSNKFYRYVEPDINANTHSLFCQTNLKELEQHFIPNVPVLIAWGVDPKLRPLSLPALQHIKASSLFFFGDKKSEFEYYHPLKRKSKTTLNFATWIKSVLESYSQNKRR